MSATNLKITRVWETELSQTRRVEDEAVIYDPAVMEFLELEEHTTAGDVAAVFAGRACYQSWAKPNPVTELDVNYIAHVQDVEHFSLFAHAGVGYYIEGVSRSLTHELIRHRWMSFSQLSQRYVKLDGDLPYVVPPLYRGNGVMEGLLAQAAGDALRHYNALLALAAEEFPDAKPKEIRQAARAVLPNMTETKIVVSANLRAWRDFLGQRLPRTADPEIRELAELLLADLKTYAPSSFMDLPPEAE